MPPKPSKPMMCNRKALPVAAKLKLIRKLEKGTSVAKLCEEYGVAQYCVNATASKSGKGLPRKHMKTARETGLDAAVLKWYVQERSVGINVHGVEIMSAANRLVHM
ncbi:Tigger transposable element-derived protein 7 [Portunus trituberculatus]|uniref:Tigger transposable element-derived protein 7 n=1 Tax=Portunus trituberculatus TaxID=210409 RepID=A0A5B7HA94_PORTR|nr:Tigger transposable element-derived protein 7 [Portunus trituberculatus]